MNFERILVPTDLSKTSLAALEAAKVLARRFGSEIILLFAVEPILVGAGGFGESAAAAQIVAEQQRVAKLGLKRLERKLGKGRFRCRSFAIDGGAARVIVDTAKRLKAGIIVIGTHGSGGVTRILIGSVADKVVRTAPCPVMTVRPQPRGSRRRA